MLGPVTAQAFRLGDEGAIRGEFIDLQFLMEAALTRPKGLRAILHPGALGIPWIDPDEAQLVDAEGKVRGVLVTGR